MELSEQREYAQLLIQAVNLAEGQNLIVRMEPVNWSFGLMVAEAAYRAGARYVRFDAEHVGVHKARVQFSREAYLEYVPSDRAITQQHYVDEGWALISIKSPDDPDALADLDAARNGTVHRSRALADRPFKAAVQADRIQWLVASLPSPRWAAKVTGKDAGDQAVDELWTAMKPLLRMDRDDPIAAWREHADALASRCSTLNELQLESVHFTGPGTDLRVGLLRESVWDGGASEGPSGRWFMPNLPTEEVFTSPDARRTQGRVTVTRPVMVQQKPVRGAWFEFRDGEVIDFGAEEGRETLDQYFSNNDGARRLGEVALVDTASPVAQSGLVFHNILLDENASCHIALGSSYPTCVRGGAAMPEDEYRQLGANISTVHTDFMIGSPEVSITGHKSDGTVVQIQENGRFVI